MSDGCQTTSHRPILNVITVADGHVNVRRAFDTSGLDKNMPFITDFVMKEMKALGQEHVFSWQECLLIVRLSYQLVTVRPG